ncbi:MAG TPA: acetate--CoA ligase [Limnochordia bacterium]|nr:acetate--CoA ligase [Limnochordia bacterium]
MALNFQHTDRVLSESRVFKPNPSEAEQTHLARYLQGKGFKSYDEAHAWSVAHPEEFWAEQAAELTWQKPWSKVLEWNPPYAKWFVGAECNIVYNALDRHMQTDVKNRVAFYWEGESGNRQTISYADLYRDTCKLANGLKSLGIKKGDRVVIYMPRIPEQIVAMLAVARIGAVHSVVFSAFTAPALKQRADDAEASAIITVDGYVYAGKDVPKKPDVDEALQGNQTVKHVVVVKRSAHDYPMQSGRDVWYHELVADQKAECPCEPVDSEHTLFTLYTSGTTGKPKGVVHTHGGYMVGAYATTKFTFDLKPGDVYWCTADPGWVTGHSYIVYGPMMLGATSVFYEGAPSIPDPGRFWAICEKYGVTVLYTAPTAIRGLMRFGDEYPNRYDLSSLRILGSVGEPINPEAWIWYHEVIGGGRAPIVDTWWQTETGVHMITPNPATPLKPGSASRPFLGIDADVVDAQGNTVTEVGKGGYLVIKKPWPAMMRTLYKDAERYETYWNTLPGRYFAGDSAYKDEDGYFWIQGRVDDVLNKAGHRLGSMEIESALVSHAAVAEAAVIGKPDPITGESIKAFVILKQGESPTDELLAAVKKSVRAELGPIAVPDEIEFVPSLPKTRSGKIMRRLLKAKELGQPIGDVSTLED